MRNQGMDGFILFIAVIFLVLAFYIYLKKDDTQYRKYADTADDIKINVSSLEAQTSKLTEAHQNALANTVTALEALNKRIEALEIKKPEAQKINLSFNEPLKISVVYRPAIKKEAERVTPNVVMKNGSLLKRAGLLDQ